MPCCSKLLSVKLHRRHVIIREREEVEDTKRDSSRVGKGLQEGRGEKGRRKKGERRGDIGKAEFIPTCLK